MPSGCRQLAQPRGPTILQGTAAKRSRHWAAKSPSRPLSGSARVHLVTTRSTMLPLESGRRAKSFFKSRLARPDDFTVRAAVCSSAPLKTVLLLQPVRSQTERQHSRAGRGEKKASLDRLLPVSTEERGFCLFQQVLAHRVPELCRDLVHCILLLDVHN